MTYANGDRYVGAWANDQPNGTGKYFLKPANATRAAWSMANLMAKALCITTMGLMTPAVEIHRKNGVGKIVTPDGKTTTGTWNMGKAVSTSTATASTPATTPSRPAPTTTSTTKPTTGKPSSTKPDVTGLRNCGSIYCRNGQGYYDYPDGSR